MTDNRTQSRPRTLTLRLEQHQHHHQQTSGVDGAGHILVGGDNLAIQAGMDYLHRLGGGTLQLGAGTYTLRNAVQLRQGVNLRGDGASTVLKKAAGHCSKLSKDADWYENQIVVDDPSGFTVGCGIMIAADIPDGQHFGSALIKDTVIGIEGHTLFLSRRLEQNAWRKDGACATASTAFSLLTAIGERGLNGGSGDSGIRDPVGDLTVSNLAVRRLIVWLIPAAMFLFLACMLECFCLQPTDHRSCMLERQLDGNVAENPLEVMSGAANGNYGGAVFLQHAHRISFVDVTARNWNGDGFSFQVCDDISFERCTSENNAVLGFHPGSGSQRPIFKDCHSLGNREGLFFCWGVTDGLAERCVFSDNRDYGITIGHRDTDNLIKDCVIERNGKVGILCGRSDATYEFFAPHRCTIQDCTLRDNGATPSIHLALSNFTLVPAN